MVFFIMAPVKTRWHQLISMKSKIMPMKRTDEANHLQDGDQASIDGQKQD
jgi:hypothetical protein